MRNKTVVLWIAAAAVLFVIVIYTLITRQPGVPTPAAPETPAAPSSQEAPATPPPSETTPSPPPP